MKTIVNATIDYWNTESHLTGYENLPNPEDGMYLWGYDCRGPDYYKYKDLYSDAGKEYESGIVINGKLI